MPDPVLFVLFGASGDLARRKVLPALYRLARSGAMPRDFLLVGVGRRAGTDDALRASLIEALWEHAGEAGHRETWERMAAACRYIRFDPDSPDGFRDLDGWLGELSRGQGVADNRLYYLAVPPSALPAMASGMAGARLGDEHGGWRRAIIEKPYGHDAASAAALDAAFHAGFREEQLYRIDHYLGKEPVRNLLALRFANRPLEAAWNAHHIESVEISVHERIGVEGRGAFYEETGALRDMIQSHLLSVLALVAMDPPETFDPACLRDAKLAALRAVELPDPVRDARRGQYGPSSAPVRPEDDPVLPAYRAEPGVAPDSRVETWAQLRLHLSAPRWRGVPFVLTAGKRMARAEALVRVRFRDVDGPLAALTPGAAELLVRLSPDPGLELHLLAKHPGQGFALERATLDWGYSERFGSPPDAYDALVADALEGDPSLFMRGDEAGEAWRIVDGVVRAWHEGDPEPYPSGSDGPGSGSTGPRREV